MGKYIIMNMLFQSLLFIAFTFISTKSHEFPLNVNGLHIKQQQNPHTDPYLHTTQLFNAIHTGKTSFTHTFKNPIIIDTDDDPDKTYEKLSTQSIRETTSTITLFSNVQYRSLDHVQNAKNIIINADNIIDCNKNINIKSGDYYVGTTNSSNTGVSGFSNYGSKVGFVFSREVVDKTHVIYDSKECVKSFTKLVHPVQIVNTHIQSLVQFPYSRVIIPTDPKRNLKGDPFTTVDSPMLLCTNDKFTKNTGLVHKSGKDSKNFHGIPINYEYSLDTNGYECLYADATVPGSINFNHATGTKAIKPTINLGTGIVCNNCYSFIGASILVVINIFGGKTRIVTFEAKDAGGVGFNIGVDITNPSFSASKYVNLAGPGPVSSIPIAYDLTLDINFAGAWATIKGTGSSKGQAKFSSGYTFYEEDSVMYANSKWSAKHTLTNNNHLKPVYSESGFKLSTTKLNAIVSVSARIAYSVGGSIPVVDIGASVDFSSVLTATIQYSKQTSGKDFSMSFMESSERKLTTQTSKTHIYYPGDKVRFKIKYEHFNPNEKTEFYLTHHHPYEMPNKDKVMDKGTGTPLAKHTFKTSSTGSGEQTIDWTVPHDSNLMQSNNDGNYFSIHSSSHLKRYYSDKHHLMQKRDRRSSNIIQYPSDGIDLPVNVPIDIRWDKYRLGYFRHLPGTDGLGSVKQSKNITLIIIAYDKHGNGNAYRLVNDIPNSGQRRVILPASLRNKGDKFKIGIHDSREYTKIGWHHGEFQLSPKRQRYEHNNNTELEPILFPAPILDTGFPLWGNNTGMQKHLIIRPSRHLLGPSTCPGAALSMMLQIEFGFDGFTVLGNKIDIGSVASNPFTIIPQTNYCL
jgi:hypothetical protein